MANYHFTTEIISRGQGRSGVQKLAYCADVVLRDKRLNEEFNRPKKTGEVHVELSLPDNAPQWIIDIENTLKYDAQNALQKLSDIVEESEKRKDAQIYREIEVSLPEELTREENIKLVEEYMHDVFGSGGRLSINCFHFDEEHGQKKPHCHIFLLTRVLEKNGLSDMKVEDSLFFKNKKSILLDWREKWASLQNRYLERNGFDVRVDHRSYEARDIDLIPQPKFGRNLREMAERGIATRKSIEFEEIRKDNLLKLVQNPEIIIDLLSQEKTTFSRDNVMRYLRRYVSDPLMMESLKTRIFLSPEVVHLLELKAPLPVLEKGRSPAEPFGTPSSKTSSLKGLNMKDLSLSARHKLLNDPKVILEIASYFESTFKYKDVLKVLNQYIDDPALFQSLDARIQNSSELIRLEGTDSDAIYTTRTLLRRERDILERVDRLTLNNVHRIKGSLVKTVMTGKDIEFKETGGLSADQKSALEHITSSAQLSCVVGYAGSGKTTVLEAAQTIWEQAGYTVLGLAFTGRASQNLITSGINAQTLSKFFVDYERGSLKFKRGTTLVLDEAGMVDSGHFQRFLEIVEKHGLKAVIIGDNAQIQPIQAGGIFKFIRDKANALQLSSILRQRTTAHREATQLFGKGDPVEALNIYRDLGAFKLIGNSMVPLISDWKDSLKRDIGSSLIIAHRRKDVAELNILARQHMKEMGRIGETEFTYKTFYENERAYSVFKEHDVEVHERTFSRGDRILFCKNDYEIGVRTGNLGTILSLDETHIIVRLDDGKEGSKPISFNPKVYKRFDYGWCTTIHKAQGVTVDNVFFLASPSLTRNLTYVAMSRHREQVSVYVPGSSLELGIQSMARAQDKTSPFDIISYEDAQNLLNQIMFFSWSRGVLQDLKEKVTSWGQETLQGFGQRIFKKTNSEERAEILYEDKFKGQSPFKKDQVFEEKWGDSLERQEIEPFHGITYKAEGNAVSKIPSQSLSPSQSTLEHGEIRSQRETTRFSWERGHDWEIVGKILSERIEELSLYILGDYKQKQGHEIVYGNKGSLRVCVSGMRQGMYYDFERGEGGNAFKLIETQLNLDKYETLQWAANWCGYDIGGFSRSRGNIGMDEKEQGKDVEGPVRIPRKEPINASKDKELELERVWTRLEEVSERAPHPSKFIRRFEERAGVVLEDLYPYKDEEGRLLGYTARFVNTEGVKQVLPLSWARSDAGIEQWKFMGFGERRSLFGREKLSAFPEKPVLLVEGEKTAVAAQDLVPGMVVVTWVGGVNGLHKTDFMSLKDRDILIWPDNDDAGKGAAVSLEALLKEVGARSFQTVDLPDVLPSKWDLADKVPEALSPTFIQETIKEHLPTVAFDKTPLDEYLVLQQKRGKYPQNYFYMDAALKAEVRGLDEKLREAAGALKEIKGHKQIVKMLGLFQEFRRDHASYQRSVEDRGMSRGDDLGYGY
ncbi:MAG: hypothetical protein B7Y25_02165 [Alphaproteobacteria bacterium 16-39-46]|nr:MAG: hypothetical protein B7Y25_02165 [Alphaproteobacteria bacterium 16-39-46]OZA43710.1 MAG: hypothetical protein B7X84_02415 [Alphaproteobacteria bacterium 17-39-52]HQS83638.1 AAA family ATPase [Alphaproteobacteria bacterium]HQS93565.1 AAA family ATPase [Alphaproteobacteria bacterium]